jgi:tetratricopeptide (TPR) repeat protein
MYRVLLALAVLLPSSVIRPQAATGPGARDYEAGRAHMRTGDADRAERSFERAVEKEPRNGLYHLWLGNAVGQQATTASVVRQPFMARRVKAAFERAVQLDPELLAPAVMGGDINKAREQQREIARRNAVRGHLAAANIAWRGRDTVATERALRAASAAAPDSLAPAAALAGRLYSWKRTRDAFGVWDAFLARDARNIAARYQFGRLAALSGERLAEGEGYLRAILAVEEWPESNWSPGKAAAHARLGDVLRQQGKRADARVSYNRALALDANSQIAKDGLKALGSSN